jgi:hypothetical protein
MIEQRGFRAACLAAVLPWAAAGGCTRTANLGAYPADAARDKNVMGTDAGRDANVTSDGPSAETRDVAGTSDLALSDAASSDGSIVPDGSPDGSNDRQDAGGGFPVTPITTDQEAAGALLAGMLAEADVYQYTALFTITAEGSAGDVLGLAATAGVTCPRRRPCRAPKAGTTR